MKLLENMKQVDITKPKNIIIVIVIFLVIFAILYIYLNHPRSVEPFANYNVNPGDTVSIPALENVVIGNENIPLNNVINTLITDKKPELLNGYVMNRDLTPITGNISEIQRNINNLLNADTNLTNNLTSLGNNFNNTINTNNNTIQSNMNELQTNLNRTIQDFTIMVNSNVATLTSIVNSAAPPFSITVYYGQTAPNGWQMCNGDKMYSMSNDIVLYKQSDNESPQELYTPNLCGRTIIGSNNNPNNKQSIDISRNLPNFTLNSYGGSANHTLTIEEMPSHNHNTRYASDNWTGPNAPIHSALGSAQTNTFRGDVLDFKGGNKPHSNMQPFYVLNYIIKKPETKGPHILNLPRLTINSQFEQKL